MPRATAARVAPLRFAGVPTAQARSIKVFSDLSGVTFANSGTAATTSIDNNSPFGAPRLRVSVPAGNTWVEVQVHGISAVPRFVEQFCARIFVQDFSRIQTVQVYVGSGASGAYTTFSHFQYLLASSNEQNCNGVHVLHVGADQQSTSGFGYGTDSLTNVKIRVLATAGAAFDFWVDEFFIPNRSRPKLVFSFDDASSSWMTKVHPVLSANNIKATFGINSGDVNAGVNFITTADIQTLNTYGHDIMPHNVTNTTVTTAGATAYAAEFDACSAFLRSAGVSRPFVYHPWVQGRHSPEAIAALRQRGVLCARGVVNRNQFVGAGLGEKIMTIDTAYMDATVTTLAQWIARLDLAIRNGKTMFSMGHEIVDAGAGVIQWLTADFDAAIDYAVRLQRLGLVDIVPASQWLAQVTE
jgi:peptidoglycan/xylan/chitin deacetylase (PgdA/CDA1 family)